MSDQQVDDFSVHEEGGPAVREEQGRAQIQMRAELAEARRTRVLSTLSACLLLLSVLATFYTLYFASDIVLPFVLAGVLNLLLSGPMRFLHHRLHIPKPLAALFLILALFGVVGGIGAAISVPATGWISKAPQSLPALQAKLAFLNEPIKAAQDGMNKLETLLNQNGNLEHSGQQVFQVQQSGPGLTSVGSSLLLGTRAFLGQIFTMLLMLFFLLYEGDSLLRRFVEIMPTWADKRRAVQIATANFVQCWLLGVPNPLLWGVLAFLLNYIPILGPLTGVVIYFFVALFSFNSILHALVPPAIYLGIHFMEGETITPLLLARRFTLNPVLVMASLMFWDWLWGIPGAFLSVPMLAVFKIVCDHVDALRPIGHIVGGSR